MTPTAYGIISVLIVSLIAVIGAIPLLLKKKASKHFLLLLLSISVGTLLGTVFIHFLPETIEHGYHMETGIYILAGFLIFFILEKFIHYHHSKGCTEHNTDVAHGHAYHLAPINLIGDGIHNFLDGLVIAGSYMVSIPLGIAATISIIFHEIPQEIADFGVLLYAGLTKIKALLFNFLSATTAILGTIIGLFLSGYTGGFNHFIIPFAAGNFIYIAASNLVPELHRKCGLWDTLVHIIAIIVGIAIVALVAIFSPEHAH